VLKSKTFAIECLKNGYFDTATNIIILHYLLNNQRSSAMPSNERNDKRSKQTEWHCLIGSVI